MLRKTLIVVILVLLALGVADARMPKVGDHVLVRVSASNYVEHLGTITDIGDGFICLHCDSNNSPNSFNSGQESSKPFDVCIGIGSIAGLVWV